MVRRVVFLAHAGICGTDTAEGFIYNDGVTDEELDHDAYDFGINHAASYGIYPYSEMPEDYDPDEACAEDDEYSENIEGWWEEYDPEKHDGKISYSHGPVWTDYTK